MSYIPITDQEVAPGNLGSTSLFQKLRDNPDAARDANRKLIKFTTAGTFNYQKPAGLKRAVFELVGAGGGGSDAGGVIDYGGGGGGGAYVLITIEAQDLDDNTQMTIGAGGYYSPLVDGGATSISVSSIGLIEAGGGKSLQRNSNGGDGGVPNQIAIDNADICKRGEVGANGMAVDKSGRGGDSELCIGAPSQTIAEAAGLNGKLGSGGSGATFIDDSQRGGRGGDGAIYITEVY